MLRGWRRRRQALLALRFQREVHHHDGILLHDADEQDHTDQRDEAEFGVEGDQRQHRAEAGGGQSGEDGDGVDEALIEHAQHHIDRRQRQQINSGWEDSDCWNTLAVPLEGAVDA